MGKRYNSNKDYKTIKFKHKFDDLIASHLIILMHITPKIEQAAWETFELFNWDKTWSFTDCTSKVVMEVLGTQEAFTFDKHFEQMRFIKKP